MIIIFKDPKRSSINEPSFFFVFLFFLLKRGSKNLFEKHSQRSVPVSMFLSDNGDMLKEIIHQAVVYHPNVRVSLICGFFNCCSIAVVPIFPHCSPLPHPIPLPTPSQSPPEHSFILHILKHTHIETDANYLCYISQNYGRKYLKILVVISLSGIMCPCI